MLHLLRRSRVPRADARLERVEAFELLADQLGALGLGARLQRTMERLEGVTGTPESEARRNGREGESLSA